MIVFNFFNERRSRWVKGIPAIMMKLLECMVSIGFKICGRSESNPCILSTHNFNESSYWNTAWNMREYRFSLNLILLYKDGTYGSIPIREYKNPFAKIRFLTYFTQWNFSLIQISHVKLVGFENTTFPFQKWGKLTYTNT